ncbi:MAG TPA: DMT family transporter [Clostridia bacterium]|nr:DMT family transporter [Clostridia bacterium]
MSSKILFLLVAIIAGAVMAIQGSLNSVLGKKIGLWEANLIVHLLGTLIVTLIILIKGSELSSIKTAFSAPWYTYLGGILNVAIIFGVTITMPKLGVCNATTAIIAGQVSTAALIDQLGLFGLQKSSFCWQMAVGFVLLLIGAKLLLK